LKDGIFVIDNVSFYPDSALATELSAEADWKRRGLYMGPKFSNLDETVQSDFDTFIEERGLNTNLALFIPDLAEWKEQK
jgi:complement component 1 Q subcomponent-binding protein, mitochondrial